MAYDTKINQGAELGFSIKSQIGSDATLLNAALATNFVYQIIDFDPTIEEIQAINDIETNSKIKDRIEAIQLRGGYLKFTTLEQAIFKNNLVLIDSLLPNVMGEIIKTFFTSNLSSIHALSAYVTQSDPLNYDTQFSHSFYEYKIKRFLTDVALGMTPSKVWNGVYDATGGYLIVKETGDVLCYHIYNRNQFEDYLFANTKLETASSTRHQFGKIYEDSGLFYFKLNLQIRFK
jgi:HpaII restriction endonuclease